MTQEEQDECVKTLDPPYTVQDFLDLEPRQVKEVIANAVEALGLHAERMLDEIKDIRKLQRKHRRSADDAIATDKD